MGMIGLRDHDVLVPVGWLGGHMVVGVGNGDMQNQRVLRRAAQEPSARNSEGDEESKRRQHGWRD